MNLGALDLSSIGLLVFAGVFMLLAIFRIVEFGDVGLSPVLKRVLIALHLIGSALFSCGMAQFALDPTQQRQGWVHALFGSGLLTLFPVHIYVALKRRIRYRDRLTSGR
jgi:hypothetical protein